MMLIVISGGQTGVDQAALRAAKRIGLPTSGWMPKGWKTTEGPRPEFASTYNMLEHDKPDYPPRTAANAKWGDATLRIATNFHSPGEKLTFNCVRKYSKPLLDLDPAKFPDPRTVAEWIISNRVGHLNVAGNSEKTSPGIGAVAEEYLMQVFEAYKKRAYEIHSLYV